MPDHDVDEIVRGLSKAQRAAILWCDSGWKVRDKACPRQVSFYLLSEVRKGNPRTEIATVYSLIDIDMSFSRDVWKAERYSLTPLGLSVRARLIEQEGSNG